MPTSKNLRVPYALAVYGKEEKTAVARVLANPKQIVPGALTRAFEERVAKLFGKKHGVMVNSGSSANLLAFELLNLPPGSEVITPALTFATTVAPILQKGLVPVFVDVTHGTYLIDIDQVERLITKKTKALMIPSLIGNVPDLARLRAIAKRHHLYLIEDSCDTLGARLRGKPTGSYSDISTTSFYASHIITAAGGGGMICVNRPDWAKRLLVLRGWGRNSSLFGESEDLKKRFATRLGDVPYDGKFIFSEVGYNFQPIELSAAFGLAQLEKLDMFAARRKKNLETLLRFFRRYEEFFILPQQTKGVATSWLAFPLTIKDDASFSRMDIVTYLEERNIQTRPVFTGNVLRQPAFQKLARGKKFPETDRVMRQSFLVGCHHGLTPAMMRHMMQAFDAFLK